MKYKSDVIIRIARCDVHVEVKYRLSRDSPIVGKNVEALELQALYKCTCHNLSSMQNVVQFIWMDGKKITTVSLWYHQRMTTMNWVDIKNGNDVVRFIKDFGR